jgi:hypothetical protein
MNAVFVDIGGWLACADRSDPAHLACMAARDDALEPCDRNFRQLGLDVQPAPRSRRARRPRARN